jgi:pilus assembly protein CpaF
MLSIVIVDPQGERHRMTYREQSIRVGRGSECELVLPAEDVSHQHCKITLADGKVVVTDLKSTNGTYVNSVRLKGPTILRPVDRMTVGRYVLQIDVAKAAARSTMRYTAVSRKPFSAPIKEGPTRIATPIAKGKKPGEVESKPSALLDLAKAEQLEQAVKKTTEADVLVGDEHKKALAPQRSGPPPLPPDALLKDPKNQARTAHRVAARGKRKRPPPRAV